MSEQKRNTQFAAVSLHKSIHDQARALAAYERRSISTVVEMALEERIKAAQAEGFVLPESEKVDAPA